MILSLIVILISIIVAVCLTEQINGHITAIRQCVLMLETIDIYLEYENLDVYKLFDALNNSNSYSKLFFIKDICDSLKVHNDFEYAYKSILKSRDSTRFLDKNDTELLNNFFSLLGKSDVNGQILNCRLYKEFFNQKLKKLENNKESKCKSNIALSVGIGIIITILII